MIRDFAATRLFVDAALGEDAVVELDAKQANYLVNVLRLADGDSVLVFNGSDGEWRAHLTAAGRKSWQLTASEQTRPQPAPPDLHYLFAPLKHARLDYMVEKAVEMGAGRLRPVLTRHTQVTRVNRDRMRANAVEAAEQCGILSLPTIDEPAPLLDIIGRWPAEEGARRLIFCDEGEEAADAAKVLTSLAADASSTTTALPLPGGERVGVRGLDHARRTAAQPPLAVLIGPEGGFAEDERQLLRSRPFVTAIGLGPRILRADTAAVAALAVVQAILGDWRPSARR